MKVAIIHDWLTTYAGAEKVLEQMLVMYPEADLFTICDFLEDNERGFLKNTTPKVSFIQKLPFAKKYYRNYLPLMTYAIEQFDLSQYDLILSSSHAVSKGVITGPDQVHISYVHSPIRYAWDLQHQYLKESNVHGLKGWIIRYLLHKIRIWDLRTANGVDLFISNSRFISKRIWKIYRRESTVVYPPVDISSFEFREDKGNYYVTASRLVPYKRVDLIVQAFAKMPDKHLVVIGDGPEKRKIESIAKGFKNIEIVGYQNNSDMKAYLSSAKAFVFAAEEDFGITPLEAQACGTPVIAYGKGGALETVIGDGFNESTGVFFKKQTVSSIIEAVNYFESLEEGSISSAACRINAEKFSHDNFRINLRSVIEGMM